MGGLISKRLMPLLSWILVLYIPCAFGFFLMPLEHVSIEQKDPITDFGKLKSPHVHVIAGSSCFSEDASFASLTAPGCCTTAAEPDDMSAYWAPMLYYDTDDGKVQAVKGRNINVYYKFIPNGSPGSKHTIEPFPDEFQMRAGSPKARTLNEVTEKVTKWRCLGNGDPAPTFEMPNRPCLSGLRAEISFPSCWNGKGPSAPGLSDHVTYPTNFKEETTNDNGEEGECPGEHSRYLPRLFMEVWFSNVDLGREWDPEVEQPFFLSQGDRSGFGLHADFMNGWKNDALKGALERCDGAGGTGSVTACFPSAGGDQADACSKDVDVSALGVDTPIPTLPDNPQITGRVKRSHSSKKLEKLLR